ncbi:putative 2-oxoglutarate-dependent dioxygenase AOP1.2 [Morella rubra]|uniref:Putative 2-oxoglutarate-dependent dioxygenase AOP1.2 n=1 Tax=Morella rubra TaxID=262757 RepID=A0A6A1VNP2_9ROSI|nr:putative 2-oxoglutarate-dependent dioxygenase AOP1.2 [Morella rubra]
MPIHSQAKIPVLDFSNEDLKPGTSPWLSARKDVCRALEEYGCFVAELGNRLPLELHNSMFGSVRELFDFPTETKKKVTSERALHGNFPNALYERVMITNATARNKFRS